MAARDPETGKFVSAEGFEDVEVVSFSAGLGVEAGNLAGATGFDGGSEHNFDGGELIDYDDVVDRNEMLVLLAGWHRLVTYINSTQTADGTVLATVEISSSPAQQMGFNITATDTDVFDTTQNIVGSSNREDSIDVVARPMTAVGHGPITDGTNGVGGAGAAGEDTVRFGRPPGEAASFHPRDELFLNGELTQWNVDDAGIHIMVTGQHWYGVDQG